MIGISGEHPMIGRDLTIPENRNAIGRSIMQFYEVQAYREADDVVVLRHDMPPALFTYRDKQLLPASQDNPDLAAKALAHSIFTQKAYTDRLYSQHSLN